MAHNGLESDLISLFLKMSGEPEDDDDFDVVNVYEDDSDSSEHEEPSTAPDVLLQGSGLKRVFIVSTARASGGHRPSCTFEGEIFDICTSGQGNYLQRVLQPTNDAAMLSLSLRYEPPSPKFSNRHPESTSYRVKLLQGSQFIYLHRGLPKVCVVDVAARSLSWGQLQLVLPDRQQLDSVLAVLRHIVVHHAEVWAPPISLLWLGSDAATASKEPETSPTPTLAPPAPGAQPPLAAAEPGPAAPAAAKKPPGHWSVWTALAQALLPGVLLSRGSPLGGLGALYRAALLLGSATAIAAVLWRMRRKVS